MNFFGIGLPEMTLIFIVALLVFGPKKLPEIGRSLGKAIRGFQDASKEFESEFKKEAERIEKSVAEPMKASLEMPEKKVLPPQAESPVSNAADMDAADTDAIDAESDKVESARAVESAQLESSGASEVSSEQSEENAPIEEASQSV